MAENVYAYMKTAYESQQAAEKAKTQPKVAASSIDYVAIPEVGAPYRLFKDGRLASLVFLKTYVNRKGFKAINIRDSEGKMHTYLLHMLIARTFVERPIGKRRVIFKDGDKMNCAADNLEWV